MVWITKDGSSIHSGSGKEFHMLRFSQKKNVKIAGGIVLTMIGAYILATIVSTSPETTLLLRALGGAIGGSMVGFGLVLLIQLNRQSSRRPSH
jgi:hypothetical protein